MRVEPRCFALPAGLLALIASFPCPIQGEELRWPYSLPSHVKYYPEDEVLIRRDEDIQQKLQQHPVVGVKKMSDDEGEKFYLDYWTFASIGSAAEDKIPGQRDDAYEGLSPLVANSTIIERATLPLLPHSNRNGIGESNLQSRYIRFPVSPRSEIGKRDFQCPTGTSDCASIDRPSSCCAAEQTCQLIRDTGLGDVGCCAAGETCAGSLSTCASGYTDCPNYPGGGCCIPGYACVSDGCLLSSTATVIVAPPPPSTQSSSVTQTSTTTTVVTSSTVIIVPPTATSDLPASSNSQSSTATTTTSTSTSAAPAASVCSTGFRSCPESLGGGCCPTNRACGRDVCPELSSTATVDAPVRPTSGVPAATSDASITGCPTGFYACSAFYQGGCCRFGRDCAPTSCPNSATTTLIDDNSVTVIATTASGLTANSVLTGACATGWSTCAISDGGGCCPTGYVCGTSCTATATAPGLQASQVGRIAPNGAVRDAGRGVNLFGISAAIVVLAVLAL